MARVVGDLVPAPTDERQSPLPQEAAIQKVRLAEDSEDTQSPAKPQCGGGTEELGLAALVEPVGAIAFYAAAAVRWLERDQPDIDEAIACLGRIVAKTRQTADVIRSDAQTTPIGFRAPP